MGGGVYLMDTWRVRPSFTLNYGLRWDFIGDQHDLKNGYTGPSAVDLFGSSGYLNVFQPGANSGPTDPLFTTSGHKYHANLVLPQPQIGFAWNPSKPDGFRLGKLFGDSKTVIRASFTLKNYTEGGQNFWNNASNSGFNFYSSGDIAANGTTTGAQYFTPGSVHLAAPGYTPGSDPLKYCTDPIATCINVSSVNAGVIPAPVQSPPSYQRRSINLLSSSSPPAASRRSTQTSSSRIPSHGRSASRGRSAGPVPLKYGTLEIAPCTTGSTSTTTRPMASITGSSGLRQRAEESRDECGRRKTW